MQECWFGIEGGGTKFICGLGNDRGDVMERITIPTTSPTETISRISDYYRQVSEISKIIGVGVGCFGPLDLDPVSPTYGYITATPKLGWKDFDIKGGLESVLGSKVRLDTDVNAALLSELKWGVGQGLTDLVYLTIGTGVGGGALSGGKLVHGMLHPEMGHMLISTAGLPQDFSGVCPYHGCCLEGLASGPALEALWGCNAADIPEDHPAWVLEAILLARGLVNIILLLSPQKIILGGGVMAQNQLFPILHETVRNLLNGYINTIHIMDDIENYIVPASFAKNTGLLGAIALATDSEDN